VTDRDDPLMLQQQRIRWDELSYRRDYEEKITRYSILLMVAVGAWVATHNDIFGASHALGAITALYGAIGLAAGAGLIMNYRSYRYNHTVLADVDDRLGLFSAPTPLLRRTRPPWWGFVLRSGVVLATWVSCLVLIHTTAPAQERQGQPGHPPAPPSEAREGAGPSHQSPVLDPDTWVAVATTTLLFGAAVGNLVAFNRAQRNLKRPIVVLRFLEEPTRFSYRLVNAGDGPAMRIRVRLGDSVPDELRSALPDPLPYDDALPPDRGDRDLQIAFGFTPNTTGTGVPLLKDPRLSVICEYEDIWGTRFRTTFENCSHRYERL